MKLEKISQLGYLNFRRLVAEKGKNQKDTKGKPHSPSVF